MIALYFTIAFTGCLITLGVITSAIQEEEDVKALTPEHTNPEPQTPDPDKINEIWEDFREGRISDITIDQDGVPHVYRREL